MFDSECIQSIVCVGKTAVCLRNVDFRVIFPPHKTERVFSNVLMHCHLFNMEKAGVFRCML